MSTIHCNITACLNNKLLIVDTNFLMNIVEALVDSMNSCNLNLSQTEKYYYFRDLLKEFLGKVCFCSLKGTISVSKRVFNNEMNPSNDESSLRKNKHFNEICPSDILFHNDLENLIREKMDIIAINNADINKIKNISNENIGDRDFSLSVLAVIESNGQTETAVITDDSALENVILDVRKAEQVQLTVSQINSEKIGPLGLFTYITTLYECCQLSKQKYDDIFLYFVKKVRAYIQKLFQKHIEQGSNPLNDLEIKRNTKKVDDALIEQGKSVTKKMIKEQLMTQL